MISVHFQGKPFNIIVIQVYALTTNAEEAEVVQFYAGLHDLLEQTSKKKKKEVLFFIGDRSSKVGSQEISNRQIWAWSTKWSRAKANRVFPKECTDHSKHEHHLKVNIKTRLIIFLATEDGEGLYSQQKQDWVLTIVQIIHSLLQRRLSNKEMILSNCGAGEDSWESLGLQGDPKGSQSWIFIGRTDLKLKLQYFTHLMRRADSFEKTLMLGKIEGRRRRGQQRMRWLDGITNSMDMSLSKHWESEGQGSLVWCSSWGHKVLDTTEPPKNNNNTMKWECRPWDLISFFSL